MRLGPMYSADASGNGQCLLLWILHRPVALQVSLTGQPPRLKLLQSTHALSSSWQAIMSTVVPACRLYRECRRDCSSQRQQCS